jgi:hypothetical protein
MRPEDAMILAGSHDRVEQKNLTFVVPKVRELFGLFEG